MTAKEKAVELVEKFKPEARQDIYDEVFKAYDAKFGRNERRTFAKVCDFSAEYHAKKCAIIAVDEIIKADPHEVKQKEYVDYKFNGTGECYYQTISTIKYWQQVKEEIEKL